MPRAAATENRRAAATSTRYGSARPLFARSLILLSAASLLAACGTSGDEGADGASTSPSGTASQSASPTDGSTTDGNSTGGGANDGGQGTASTGPGSSDAGGDTDPAAGTVVLTAVSEPVDVADAERTDDGYPIIAQADLIAVLESTTNGTDAGCDGDLPLAPGYEVPCMVVAGMDSAERRDARAYPVVLAGGEPAVLFAFTPDGVPETAREALYDGQNEVIAMEMGGAYGMDPVEPAQLVRDVQSVIDTSAEDPAADWGLTVTSCEGPLDATRFEPVTCEAEADGSGGATVRLRVLPGTFMLAEPGLIVSADNQVDV